MRLWVIMKKNHKISEQLTVELESPGLSDVIFALDGALKTMDVARPLILPKHEREIEEYGKTWFRDSDFMEKVRFDRLELEVLYDDDRKKRSNDPRNDFGSMGGFGGW
jgi:hypothetical protein